MLPVAAMSSLCLCENSFSFLLSYFEIRFRSLLLRCRRPLHLLLTALLLCGTFLVFTFQCFEIDLLRKFRELDVCFLFFLERLLQQRHRAAFTEQLGVCAYAAIPCNFVVFHVLRSRDQPRIKFGGLVIFFDEFFSLFD